MEAALKGSGRDSDFTIVSAGPCRDSVLIPLMFMARYSAEHVHVSRGHDSGEDNFAFVSLTLRRDGGLASLKKSTEARTRQVVPLVRMGFVRPSRVRQNGADECCAIRPRRGSSRPGTLGLTI